MTQPRDPVAIVRAELLAAHHRRAFVVECLFWALVIALTVAVAVAWWLL